MAPFTKANINKVVYAMTKALMDMDLGDSSDLFVDHDDVDMEPFRDAVGGCGFRISRTS